LPSNEAGFILLYMGEQSRCLNRHDQKADSRAVGGGPITSFAGEKRRKETIRKGQNNKRPRQRGKGQNEIGASKTSVGNPCCQERKVEEKYLNSDRYARSILKELSAQLSGQQEVTRSNRGGKRTGGLVTRETNLCSERKGSRCPKSGRAALRIHEKNVTASARKKELE